MGPDPVGVYAALFARFGLHADTGMGSLGAEQSAAFREILFLVSECIRDLVNEVSAVILDHKVVFLSVCAVIHAVLPGQEAAGGGLLVQFVLFHAAGADPDGIQPFSLVEYRQCLFLLVDQDPVLISGIDHLQPVQRNPAGDFLAFLVVPGFNPGPAVPDFENTQCLGLSVQGAEHGGLRIRLQEYLLVVGDFDVHHHGRLRHHLPDCRVVIPGLGHNPSGHLHFCRRGFFIFNPDTEFTGIFRIGNLIHTDRVFSGCDFGFTGNPGQCR